MKAERQIVNKFTPTDAWRKRQRLDKILGDVKDATECLLFAREHKAFDRANFDYALRQLEKSVPRLAKFYRRHK